MGAGNKKTMDLNGAVVIVTGAGRGLGRSYAQLLGAYGARVVVNDLGCDKDGNGRSIETAQSVVDELRQAGAEAVANGSDVATADGAAELVGQAMEAFGQLDCVINNAGVFLPMRPLEETPFEDFERLWRVHFGSTYHMCQQALAMFASTGRGRITNTCSIQGLYGAAQSAPYAAAKGAVQSFTLSLAAKVRGSGISVNGISPGGFTRMLDDGARDPALVAALESHLSSDLAAPMAVWLCHPSCTANGEIFQAYAGRFSRTVIGEPEGFWSAHPTPESIAESSHLIYADGPLMTAGDSVAMAKQVMAESAHRKSQQPQ